MMRSVSISSSPSSSGSVRVSLQQESRRVRYRREKNRYIINPNGNEHSTRLPSNNNSRSNSSSSSRSNMFFFSQTGLFLCCSLLLRSLHNHNGSIIPLAHGFLVSPPLSPALMQSGTSAYSSFARRAPSSSTTTSSTTSTTALHVWWFGGSEELEGSTNLNSDDRNSDSCELVPVRIERTSPNSRRIFGEITAPNLSLDQVWSILTDYNRLSVHVPNLVESKIVGSSSSSSQQQQQQRGGTRPGDGHYTCRLFQKGAQKIIGFEFGASVTMNMREQVISKNERRINFECVDSFFFQEFDGVWKVVERPTSDGSVETTISYVVEVRPKGPVPVAALEWRIREDVPTNLRAVKRAAATQQAALPLVRSREFQRQLNQELGSINGAGAAAVTPITRISGMSRSSSQKQKQQQQQSRTLAGRQALLGNLRERITWERSETMAAYLDK